MFDECAWSPGPAGASGLELLRIWRVEADETYHPTKEQGVSGLVAVRTTGGEGRIGLDGVGDLTLPTNSLLLAEGSRIRWYRPAEAAWDFWWFECRILGPVHVPLNQVMQVPAEADEAETLQQCFSVLPGREFLGRAEASARFAAQLYGWARRWRGQVHPPSENRRLVDRAIERMRTEMAQPVNVSDLARQAGMSERWFRRIFREVTSQSPKAYYDALRLDAAAELLRMGQANVAQVARRLGYSSPFHLSRAFKAHHGLSPSAYRKT